MNVRKRATSRLSGGKGDLSHMSTKRNTDIALRLAASLYLVGLVAHTADHFRRGTSVLTTEVLVGAHDRHQHPVLAEHLRRYPLMTEPMTPELVPLTVLQQRNLPAGPAG